MTSAITAALQRQADRPDIHHRVAPLKSSKVGYDASVALMITDLKEHVPGISTRQLSTLVGISRRSVDKVLESVSVPVAEWSEENNEASAAAELAALMQHHPDSQYKDDEDALRESDVPVTFTAPPLSDLHRRADQSHTLPRPITLPTTPFRVAA